MKFYPIDRLYRENRKKNTYIGWKKDSLIYLSTLIAVKFFLNTFR